MNAPSEPSAPRAALSPLIRFGVVGVIAVGAAIVCVMAQIGSGRDHQVAFLTSASTAAGAFLLILGWCVLTIRTSLLKRFKILGAIGLVIGAVVALVRIDETSGDVVPKLAWRWTPKADVALANEFADLVGGTADLATITPDDYPQFLGPNRDGTVPGPQLARDWSKHPPREIWRRPIGAGWSSYAIRGNYAVTQEQRGANELIVCYELATGKPVWYHADEVRYEEILAGVGPRSTPTIDGGKVYAMGATGLLNCLDGATGRKLWSHDVPKESGADTEELKPQWGKSCSPLVVGNLVVVSAGAPDGKSLLAYNKETGDVVWHAGDDPSSYSSPQLATLAGKEQIVIINRESVVGHDLADGHVLWRFEWLMPNPKCAQPLVTGSDTVLVSAGYGRGSALLQIAGSDSDGFSVAQLWNEKSLLNLKSKFADMILHNGDVYALDDGILCCVEAETGKRRWKGGRYQHGQLLAVGDLLVVMAEYGELVLVDLQPKRHIELGHIPALTGKTWNNPAIKGRLLLVRNHSEAVCYELALAEDEEAAEPSSTGAEQTGTERSTIEPSAAEPDAPAAK